MKSLPLLYFALFLSSHLALGGEAHVRGLITNSTTGNVDCRIVSNNFQAKPIGIVIPIREGRFDYRFDISTTVFLSLSDGVNNYGGFIQPGDNILIRYNRLDFSNSVSYSGSGKEKFEIFKLINEIRNVPSKYWEVAKASRFPVDYVFSAIDSLKASIDNHITGASLTRESQDQLRGALAASELEAKHKSLVAVFRDSYSNIIVKHSERLSKASISQMQELYRFDGVHWKSKLYIDVVRDIASIYVEENVQSETNDFSKRRYQILADILPDKLRSPVIFLTLRSDISTNQFDERTIEDGINQLTDNELKTAIRALIAEKQKLRNGQKAPDFLVENLFGEKVSLASFRGKTIYLDFWFASCGPCHLLFKSIHPVKEKYQSDDRVVFLTISVDNQDVWKKAITKFGVDGYHVFTEDKLREHPIIKHYNITAYPTTFIIRPDGFFHSVEPSKNPEILMKQIEESISTGEK